MNMRRGGHLVLVLLVMAGLAGLWAVRQAALPEPPVPKGIKMESDTMSDANRPGICEEVSFEGARAILCTVDLSEFRIVLAYRDGGGGVYGSVEKAVAGLSSGDRLPVLAMNAGMYHADMTPVGLYVEDGAEISALNLEDGFGNFFLKPNGVFYVRDDGSAGVMETEAYGEAGISPAYATQSGPMLVIGGALHPRFLPDGTSKYIRNGVGVRADGTVVFAITRDPVSLGSFGRLFRDVAECPDALFFDGAVSSLAWGSHMEIDAGEPAGPVVAVFRKQDD